MPEIFNMRNKHLLEWGPHLGFFLDFLPTPVCCSIFLQDTHAFSLQRFSHKTGAEPGQPLRLSSLFPHCIRLISPCSSTITGQCLLHHPRGHWEEMWPTPTLIPAALSSTNELSLEGYLSSLACFLLFWQNTWDWVTYKEKKFMWTHGSGGRKVQGHNVIIWEVFIAWQKVKQQAEGWHCGTEN